MSQSLGFFKTLYSASIRPRAFFEQWTQGAVRVHPLWIYAGGQACASVGLTAAAAVLSQDSVLREVAIAVVAGVVTAPVSWWLSAAVMQVVGRLFGVRGEFRESQAAIGYAGAPRLLGLLPLGILVGEVWSIVVSVRGLQVVRKLKALPATALALSPLILSVGLALALRVMVVEAFKVPSGSMYPTVEFGDHLFVWKLGQGARRGDIVVFEEPYPREPDREPEQFLKRVIALPGEELLVDGGQPLINGWRVPRCLLGEAVQAEPFEVDQGTDLEIFVEFLEGRAYLVARDPLRDQHREGPYVVGANEVFVLGDNRDNSADSRAWRAGRGGGVPFENIGGLGWFLWLPLPRLGVRLDAAPVLPPSAAHLQPMLDRCLARAPSAEQTRPPRK